MMELGGWSRKTGNMGIVRCSHIISSRFPYKHTPHLIRMSGILMVDRPGYRLMKSSGSMI